MQLNVQRGPLQHYLLKHVSQVIPQLVPRVKWRQAEGSLDEPQNGNIIHLHVRYVVSLGCG
jgi:hypothetical protein